MKLNSYTPLLALVARLALTGTFVWAALPKIKDPVAFGAAIHGFQVIDGALVNWTALILPWLELIIAIGLLIPMIRRTSGACIGLLLAIFIGLHASAWQRGLDISCGCFGTETEPTADYRLLILRNLVLLIATIWILRRDAQAHKLPYAIAP